MTPETGPIDDGARVTIHPTLTDDVPGCPLCGGTRTQLIQRHSLAAAAEHFVPKRRDPIRRARLEVVLRRCWSGKDAVEVRRCESCGFGFAAPHVAGDKEFYNLVSGGDPHYPNQRWEFDRTVAELAGLTNLGGELLECGAGDGSFLARLRSSSVGNRFQPLASEYDEAALRTLGANGIAVWDGSISELAEIAGDRFDVICIFQALEHMDDPHSVFGAFRRLGRPGSHIFVSVPNGPAIDAQERLVHYWDMPPNHIGRWTRACFRMVAHQHGLLLIACEDEPSSRIGRAWRLAVYRVNSQAYDDHSLAGRLNGIGPRLVRGPLKRMLAASLFLRLLPATSGAEGDTLWVHLQKPELPSA